MINLHPNGEAFLYGICITWGHLLLMEAIMNTVVQGLGNAMLCVTFAMIVEGALLLFAGFFIKIGDMPAWIRWIPYIIPTKYSFDGYLHMIFHGQTFCLSGTEIMVPGDTILNRLYGQNDVRPLLAWIVLIRLCHYGVFLFQLVPSLSSRRRGAIATDSNLKMIGQVESHVERNRFL